jgi:hypothetical protein
VRRDSGEVTAVVGDNAGLPRLGSLCEADDGVEGFKAE